MNNPTKIGTVALVAAGLLAACGEQSLEENPFIDDTTSIIATHSEPFTMAPPLDPAAAETKWRWLGYKRYRDQECPRPQPQSGFNVRHLFSTGQDVAGYIPPGLRSYCVYEAAAGSQGGFNADLLRDLLSANHNDNNWLTRLEPDRMAVARSAPALTNIVSPTFTDEFAEHSGRMAHHSTWYSQGQSVRLAMLDTSPTRAPNQMPEQVIGNSDHGFSMINMARQLVCDDAGSCVAEVSSRLAMPLMTNELGEVFADEVNGGTFGSIASLAEAIRAEVNAWQQDAFYNERESRLVMNMSLGWLPDYGGTGRSYSRSWPLDVQAVYRSLIDAHCRGTLLIAAAGNDSGGPTSTTGALLPGLWETHKAPSRGWCRYITGENPSEDPTAATSTYRPLLYAVGGIDATGQDLANARSGGRPRIVAYSDHGSVTDPWGDNTPSKTGSSVGTVVTASAAAAAWYYAHDLSLYDVMEAVYLGGQKVKPTPDFCLSSAGPSCGGRARRATVCEAVDYACTSGLSSVACPTWDFDPCEPWQRDGADLSTVSFWTFDAAPATIHDNYVHSYLGKWPAACGPDDIYKASGVGLGDPCPAKQYYSFEAMPWTEPQPGWGGCDDCILYPGSDLVRLTNTTGGSYQNPMVSVTTSSGTSNYSLGSSLVGSSFNLGFTPGLFGGTQSASFSGTVNGASFSSPLYLGW